MCRALTFLFLGVILILPIHIMANTPAEPSTTQSNATPADPSVASSVGTVSTNCPDDSTEGRGLEAHKTEGTVTTQTQGVQQGAIE